MLPGDLRFFLLNLRHGTWQLWSTTDPVWRWMSLVATTVDWHDIKYTFFYYLLLFLPGNYILVTQWTVTLFGVCMSDVSPFLYFSPDVNWTRPMRSWGKCWLRWFAAPSQPKSWLDKRSAPEPKHPSRRTIGGAQRGTKTHRNQVC